mmetsp:Transcript_27497/g.39365  ORF Transcript_27497/g.39365 Transcript_27497/m.39365 type:complete len:227 (+) Transcript_27497:111-791(+)|eukprot:CAMPEP_0172418528 /NCGR_PEP_ID=MMETSP1064-20121228/5002_1 /TAXON_ID=202472 /ORGANISM="Aulacoseira subarctica , Strain CCAP 1002/5" /LENGTH=226 /DNA_ID=CAMNT_0013157497 /DNA_START=46 /DNA_END=729 /DNA_ORIENTATION=+
MSSLNSTFHSHTTAATTTSNGDSSSFRRFFRRLLQPCEVNPKASVDKAWALAIILKVLMVLTALILILRNSHADNGYSHALLLAATWTVFLLCVMGAIGTFILHRLSSNFSIGFFLGLLIIVSQQNIILFAAFNNYDDSGGSGTNQIFATLSLLLGMVYLVFAIILGHFRDQVVSAAKEVESAPSLGSLKEFHVLQWKNTTTTTTAAAASTNSTASSPRDGAFRVG